MSDGIRSQPTDLVQHQFDSDLLDVRPVSRAWGIPEYPGAAEAALQLPDAPPPIRVECSSVTLTLNGKPLEGFSAVSYESAPRPRPIGPTMGTYSASARFTIRTDRRFKGRGREAYQRRCAYRRMRALAEGCPF